MKFSYNLIKKLAPGKYTKEKLVEKLNLHSFEAVDLGGDVLEVAVPPNRYSDAASHLGVAREAALIFGEKLLDPTLNKFKPDARGRGLFTANIKEKDLCGRYMAAYVTDLKSGQRTPEWMKGALESSGLRPINLIVDIMNYVMLEVGQPMHAFDADRVSGGLVVRRAKKGESIETIDRQKFNLDDEVLIIADGEQPLAIAGIKGGKFSEVNPGAKRILVEAAQFSGANIYRTARKLRLVTDASVRFSHDLSPELAVLGMKRALALLQELAGAKAYEPLDVYPKPQSRKILSLSAKKINDLIGGSFSLKEIGEILSGLSFRKLGSRFEAPPFRKDIESLEDLAEEIARVHGYSDLPAKPPKISLGIASEEETVRIKDRLRQFWAQAGFSEVYNYSFLSFKESSQSAVKILNPISKESEFLRESLAPGLKKNLDHNLKFWKEVRVFEIGRVFSWHKNELKEESFLGAAVAAKDAFRELKGLLESLADSLGVTDYGFGFESDGLLIFKIDGEVLGRLETIEELGNSAALLEINMEKLSKIASEERGFRQLPKFPSVVRDISIFIDGGVRVGEILESIERLSPKILTDVDLVDSYSPIQEESRGRNARQPTRNSMTFRLIFQAEDRTLTDDEVNREVAIIQKALTDKFEAELR